MINQTIDSQSLMTQKPARPTFITVLCILSFIGNGLVMITSLISLLTYKATVQTIEMASSVMSENSSTNIFSGLFNSSVRMIEYVPLIQGVTLAAAFINVIGVIFMWRLQKVGFYIYTVTELAPVIISTVIYFQIMGSFGIFVNIIGWLIALAFIIMYGLNLKHMK